jgi:hypothetical protein
MNDLDRARVLARAVQRIAKARGIADQHGVNEAGLRQVRHSAQRTFVVGLRKYDVSAQRARPLVQ